MTDLILALAFIAMVATPAMVATFGGRKEYNPDPGSDCQPEEDNYPVRAPKRPTARIIRPHSMQSVSESMISDDATLPILNRRGMANR